MGDSGQTIDDFEPDMGVEEIEARSELLLQDAGIRAEAVTAHAQAIFYAIFTLNGGAIIALLTFLSDTSTGYEPDAFRLAFIFYGIGLITIVLSQYFRYRGNAEFVRQSYFEVISMRADAQRAIKLKAVAEEHFEAGRLRFRLSEVTIHASVFAFVVASWLALEAIALNR